MQPLQLEFHKGFVGLFGKISASDGPRTSPDVSLKYVGICVTKLYTYAS